MNSTLYTLVTLTSFSISRQEAWPRASEQVALPLEMLDLTYIVAICKVRGYMLLTCETYVVICPYELCKIK